MSARSVVCVCGDALTEVPAWWDGGMETSWPCWASAFSLESAEGWLGIPPTPDRLLPSLMLCWLHEIA